MLFQANLLHSLSMSLVQSLWWWTLAGSGDESEGEEWQLCDVKRSDGHTLTISSVQKSNEGSYHCVISNCAGSQNSEPAVLTVGKSPISIEISAGAKNDTAAFLLSLFVAEPPRITDHPQKFKDVVPGSPVDFTIGITGTEPLSYQWQLWKLAGEKGGSEEWQLCDVEGPPTATLSIPSVQKSNEGKYRCIIRNCAGSQTSNTATLTVGKKSIKYC